MKRYAARRDNVELELIRFARQLGAWLVQTDWPCDWILWWRGHWELVEIKDPEKEGHKDEFTPAQWEFRKEAQERGARLVIWRRDADVLATLNATRGA